MNASRLIRVRSLFAGLLACLVLLVATLGAAPGPLPAASTAVRAITNGELTQLFYLPLVFNRPDWLPVTIESSVTFGELSNRAIAVTPQGMPCVVYGNDHLYLRCLKNGEWQLSEVDPNPGVGRWASLVFDASNMPVIAYYDEINGALKVARPYGGRWSVEVVDGGDLSMASAGLPADLELQAQFPISGKHGVGGRPAVAVDAAGLVHVSYYDFDNQDLKYDYWNGSAWDIEVVDANMAGEYSSIAVNALGVPYIAYYDGANQDAKLASRVGGAWSTTTIFSDGQVGEFISLALAKDGSPRAAFYSLPGHQLLYWNGTGVTTAAADASDAVDLGRYASLALDKNDKPWISYYNKTSGDLQVAHLEGKYWEHEIVDFFEDTGTYTSIVTNASGNPLMVYFAPTLNLLRYASGKFRTATDSWEFLVMDIDTTNQVGMWPEIDLNNHNRPAVAYINQNRSLIMFAEWTGTTWWVRSAGPVDTLDTRFAMDIAPSGQPFIVHRYPAADNDVALLLLYRENVSDWRTLQVDIDPDLGDYPSVAADGFSRPHMSYYDGRYGDLRYAIFNGVSVQRTIVDAAGNVGQFTSIAVDSAGHPWISYYDVSNADLKLAHYNGTSWVTQTVDSAGNVGAGTWLALDQNDNPRIAYYDATNQRIKFAAWNGSAWSIEVIDPTVKAGSDADLSLDANGRAGISYYDQDRLQLKFAYQVSGAWQYELIDTAGDVGRTNAVVLGPDGRAHAAYYDATNGDPKYAIK
jgi:hypothetical protein